MKTKLVDITDIIRSKNSGPYELTLDIMFKDFESFEKVCAAKVINEETVCRLYNIAPADIINIVEGIRYQLAPEEIQKLLTVADFS